MAQLTASERSKLAELRRRVQRVPPPKIPVPEKRFTSLKAVERGVIGLVVICLGVLVGWFIKAVHDMNVNGLIEFFMPRVWP